MGRSVAVLLTLLSAGCATASLPQPQVAATQPATPEPVAKPVDKPAASAPSPKPAAAVPAPRAVASAPGARPAARPVAVPRAAAATQTAKPAAAPSLDLDALEARLRATKAIGVFTKISLKNKVDDLMKQFSAHYQGRTTPTKAQLRQSYDLLMMKVLSLLQDGDPPLATAVVSSREAIWAVLANEKTFAALQL